MTPGAAQSEALVSAAAADPGAPLDTFPKMLLAHARQRPERPAMREKDYGIWQTSTWGEAAEEVRALACGLAALGLRRGHNIADGMPPG